MVSDIMILSNARCTGARQPRAFTLIELLVTVAIISILAAIAVPNFLEAQVRSKVSRVSADMRTIATSIESYVIDHNQYPPENWPGTDLVSLSGVGQFTPNLMRLTRLTTPVSYITSVPADIFAPGDDPLNQMHPRTYHYVSANDPLYPGEQTFFFGQNEEKRYMMWMLQSCGPDRGSDGVMSSTYWQFPRYDATNGTVSIGNVLRSGP